MDRFTSISDVNEGSSSTARNYSRTDTPPPDILDEENVVLAKRRGGQLLTTDGPLLLTKVALPPVNCGEDDDDDNNSEYDYNDDDITRLQEETKVEQEAPVSAATSDVKEEVSETRPLQNTGLGLLAEPISVTVPKTGIDRFRALVNMVKNNLKWANALGSQDDDANEVHHVEGEEMLTFNVDAFKANVQAVNPLTPEIKMILCTHSWNRSTSNIKTVFKFLNKLTFFDKYSHTVKMELASVLYYEKFEEGRVLVKQGHPGRSFYYILSGSVIIEVTEEDARTGEKKTQVVGETPAGSAFGELALLHETKRTATIVCKGDSEFLRVDKPDFDMVLRRSYQQEWDNGMTALKSLITFEDWTEEELQSAIDRCTFEEYPPNTVILSDPEQAPDHVYFIKSGECKIVRDVTLIKSNLPFGHVKLSLPPYTPEMDVEPEFLSKYQGNLHNATLHICTFGKGRFFGVGEDLRKTHIISIGKVECILVARVAFLFHNHGRCIAPMKQSVEELIPSREDAFNSYIEGIKWRNYKRGLVKELVNRRHIPNNTTMAEVPLVLRRETQR
ncbi:uncharacterized protein [Antedon mediterranea]|uniref:uncharacterized protein n=1 Tax=Antedon mediterranea TaxID=105859 RepID=UPI003AF99609